MKKIVMFVCLSLLAFLAFAVNAAAYLDPSATAYIIQIISGAVIVVGAGIAIFWKKIRLYFKKKKQDARMAELSKEEKARDAADENPQ